MSAVRSAVSAALLLAGSLVVSSGCGRFYFERLATSDADTNATTTDGTDVDAAGCDPTAPFGVPELIPGLSDPVVTDGTLRLYPDELRGYFWSYRGTGTDADLYYVSRPDLATPFTITPVQGLATTAQELDPTFPSDGSIFVFRRSGPGNELFVTTPVSGAPDSFNAPTNITTINTASDEAQAFIPLGRNELYFESTRTALGDIYMSTFTGTTFAPPTLVQGIASASDEGDPVVTPDGLTIYFRSNRAAALPGYNIFVATRTATTDPFGALQLAPNINTAADDGPSFISPDGCRLYLSSDVAGTNDIYVATRGR